MDLEHLAYLGFPGFATRVTQWHLPEETAPLALKVDGPKREQPAKSAPAQASKDVSASANDGAQLKSSKDSNFLEKWIEADLAPGGRCEGKKVMTRFPPEPNGYLHIGHAKSILTNFGLAQKYGGQCNLRFDDTNPETEEVEYVESIKNDVCWITEALELEHCKKGEKPWRDSLFFASDYFEQMHSFAVGLIKAGKAYVDSQTPDEVQKNRGWRA